MNERPVAVVSLVVASCATSDKPTSEYVGINGWELTGSSSSMVEVRLPIEHTRPVTVAMAAAVETDHTRGGDSVRTCVSVLTTPPPDDSSRNMVSTFRQADHLVRTAIGGTEAGCSAALVVAGEDGSVQVGNVGSVRIYRLVDGYAGELTVDDRAHGGKRGTAGRCLGTETRAPEPHVHQFSSTANELLVLCSAAFHDVVTLSSLRIASQDPRSVATRLISGPGARLARPTTLVVVKIERPRQ